MPAKKKNKSAAPVAAAAEKPAAGYAEKVAKVAKPSRTGDTVTVGLKVPNGLVLQLQEKVKVSYPVMGGGMREVDEMRPAADVQTYTLHGARAPFGEQPRCLVVAGFAMTPGIPKDFWDQWLAQNRNLDLVKNGLIMAHASQASVSDEARDKRALLCGLEPIKPGNDPRIPKRRKRGTNEMEDAIETGEEQPASKAA